MEELSTRHEVVTGEYLQGVYTRKQSMPPPPPTFVNSDLQRDSRPSASGHLLSVSTILEPDGHAHSNNDKVIEETAMEIEHTPTVKEPTCSEKGQTGGTLTGTGAEDHGDCSGRPNTEEPNEGQLEEQPEVNVDTQDHEENPYRHMPTVLPDCDDDSSGTEGEHEL